MFYLLLPCEIRAHKEQNSSKLRLPIGGREGLYIYFKLVFEMLWAIRMGSLRQRSHCYKDSNGEIPRISIFKAI
jgi:hypothetical protein